MWLLEKKIYKLTAHLTHLFVWVRIENVGL